MLFFQNLNVILYYRMDFAIFYEIDKLRQKKVTKIKKRVKFSKNVQIYRYFS